MLIVIFFLLGLKFIVDIEPTTKSKITIGTNNFFFSKFRESKIEIPNHKQPKLGIKYLGCKIGLYTKDAIKLK